MNVEDVKIGMIVQVIKDYDGDHFSCGEKILVKGIVLYKGHYFILSGAISKEAQVIGNTSINVNKVEPILTELEQIKETIKKEIIE